MEPSKQVELREPGSTSKFIQELIDNRKWILAFNCQSVKLSIINDESLGVFVLAHHYNWGGKGIVAPLDHARSQHLRNLFLNFCFQFRSQAVWSDGERTSTRDQRNRMVIMATRR